MVARSTKVVSVVWLLGLRILGPTLLLGAACAPNGTGGAGASGSESSAAATASESGAECPAVGPYDAAAFTFRASCTYGLPSDASAASACDEWSQGGVNDWGEFIEDCIQKNGTLSAQPCVMTRQVGECLYAASCSSQLATYVYASANATDGDSAASFEPACLASVGATWTPM